MDGAQIRTARERMRLTQAQLAQKVGVGQRTVGNWERGDTVPQSRLGALRDVLGIDTAPANPLLELSDATLLTELMRRAVERDQQ